MSARTSFGMAITAFGAILCAVQPASAHLVSTELGPFYDGAAHPLVTPDDLLTILGLAALAAFGGPASGRRLLVALVVGWSVGLVLAFGLAHREWQAPIATACTLLVLGVATLLKVPVPTLLLVAVGAVIGLARGALNGSAARMADGQWLSIVGIAAGVFALTCMSAALGVVLEKRGWSIALRVGGSWIAAIGLLLLGWQLRTMLVPAG
ncbi:MAG: HupE/UreJ family protein [Phycisphaerales bacterium]|nr:HupE/UreJ family protein [Phycisphaerales bacterium]